MFNENDSHHEQAQHLFSANPGVVIPEYVILEVVTVLQLRVSKQHANLFAKMVGSTLGFEILHASDEFFQQVVTVFQQQSQKLSFVDCALLALANGHTVHTFDVELARAIASAT